MALADAWGARPGDADAVTPAHALLPAADEHCIRAVEVAAPADLVWRWVCQLRAAPYSYDTLDNLGRRSPQELTPGLDALAPGQSVMTIFRVASFSRPEHLTVQLRRGIPEMAVSYVVTPEGPERSRLVMHLLIRLPGLARNPAGRAAMSLLRAGDLVMARRQLLNLRDLAERDAAR